MITDSVSPPPDPHPGGDTATTQQRAATLIAQNLAGGLVHPGNSADQPRTAILLPEFRTAGMPPQLADAINTTAQLIGEAIVHLLEHHGIRQVADSELEQPNPEPQPGNPITICCPHNRPILEIMPKPNIRLNTTQHAALTAQCDHQ